MVDRTQYIDPDGGTHDVVPIYSSRNPPQVIAPGKRRVYEVIPADYLGHRALFEGPKRFVVERPEEILDRYKHQVDKTFRVRLPVQLGALIYEYEFSIVVSNVRPRVYPRQLF